MHTNRIFLCRVELTIDLLELSQLDTQLNPKHKLQKDHWNDAVAHNLCESTASLGFRV